MLPCGSRLLPVGIEVGIAQSFFEEQAAETMALEGGIGFVFVESLLESGQAVVVAVTERQTVLREVETNEAFRIAHRLVVEPLVKITIGDDAAAIHGRPVERLTLLRTQPVAQVRRHRHQRRRGILSEPVERASGGAAPRRLPRPVGARVLDPRHAAHLRPHLGRGIGRRQFGGARLVVVEIGAPRRIVGRVDEDADDLRDAALLARPFDPAFDRRCRSVMRSSSTDVA